MEIVPVGPNDFIARWSEVEPLLDKALDVAMRRWEPIDILPMLIQQQALGWFVLDGTDLVAIIVTQITRYPRKIGLNVFALAGRDMKQWFVKAEETLTEYAKRAGCHFIELQGRRGWNRVLDLEPRCVLLCKSIV